MNEEFEKQLQELQKKSANWKKAQSINAVKIIMTVFFIRYIIKITFSLFSIILYH